MNHTDRLEWDSHGRCNYRVMKEKKCKGVPGYSGGCQGTYTDDYGSTGFCPTCRGNGKVIEWRNIRVPEFDAPKPPKNWTPDWIEERIK